MMGTCTDLLGEGLSMLGLWQVCKKGIYARVQVGGIWSKQAKQPVFRLPAFTRCPCSYAEGQGRKWSPPTLLSPERHHFEHHLSQMHSKKKAKSVSSLSLR